MTKFYARTAQIVAATTAGDSPRTLMLLTEDLFAGREATERIRQAVAGRGRLESALAETGIDWRELSAQPGIVLLRPRRISAEAAALPDAIDQRINQETAAFAAAADRRPAGELFYHATRAMRLPSFDAQSPFGAEQTHLQLQPVAVTLGGDAAEGAAAALAGGDFLAWVEGGAGVGLSESPTDVAARRLFAALPRDAQVVAQQRRQPVTVRTLSQSDAATICASNESPWPVDVEIALKAPTSSTWNRVGLEAATTSKSSEPPSDAAQGIAPAGDSAWKLTLPPHGIAVRRYASNQLQLSGVAVQPAAAARQVLSARVAQLEQRLPDLDVQRPYSGLANGGFELVGADGRMLGWLPRIGAAGSVETDAAQATSGGKSLRLHSEDALGVAAQSQSFAVPTTGQLTIRAKVRVQGLDEPTQLIAWIEYGDGPAPQRRFAPLGGRQRFTGEWSACELFVDDLPLDEGKTHMRIQFHLAGRGQAWIDDVELLDLQFPPQQRQEMVKRLLAAQSALEEGQIVDCQRLVEGYWPRLLIEQAATGPAASLQVATRPEEPTEKSPDEGQGGRRFGDRLRGFVPKIIR